MNLMLLLITVSTLVGLFGSSFGSRQMRVLAVIAVAFTLIYYLRPQYMT